MANNHNLVEEVAVGNKAAEKRWTVVIGERVGDLLQRLRGVNGDATTALAYFSGSVLTEGSAGGDAARLGPEGFIEELVDALNKIEQEVSELEDTIRRLNNL